MANKKQSYSVRLEIENGKVAKAELVSFGKDGSKSLQQLGEAGVKASKGLGGLRVAAKGLDVVRKGLFNLKTAAIGLLGTAGFVGLTKQALDYSAQIEDLSKTANVSAEAIQELRFATRQFGIETEDLTDGLKEVTLRADEFAQTGTGPAAESFKRLGLSQKEVNDLLGDTDKLFSVVIERMRETGDEAANVRIADELFGGTAGEKFVRLLDDSAQSLDTLRQEARDLGIVLSTETVRAADKARDRVRVLGDVLKLNLSRAIAENSDRISDFADRVIDELPEAIEKLERLAEVLGIFERQATAESLREVEAEIAAINETIARGPTFADRLATAIATPNPDEYGRVFSDDNTLGQEAAREKRRELLLEQYRIQTDLMAQSQEKANQATRDEAEAHKQAEEAKKRNATATSDLAKELDANRESDRLLIEEMQFEIDLMGLSERRQASLRAERSLSANATEEQRAQVRELAEALYDEQQVLKENEEQAKNTDRRMQGLARTIDGGLDDALRGSMSSWSDWGDFALNIIGDVVSELFRLQSASAGASSIGEALAAGIFGAFGGSSSSYDPAVSPPPVKPSFPGRASGGPVVAGRVYRFREIQEELLVPNMDGRVVPAGGGNSQDIKVSVENNTDSYAQAEKRQGPNGEKEIIIWLDRAWAANAMNPGTATRRALKSFANEGVNR